MVMPSPMTKAAPTKPRGHPVGAAFAALLVCSYPAAVLDAVIVVGPLIIVLADCLEEARPFLSILTNYHR